MSARRATGETIQPIDFTLIKHWSQMTQTEINPDEITTITMMDDAYTNAISTERAERYERDRNKNQGN